MTCPTMGNAASCEIRAVIHFLRAKNMSVVEIHSELWAVYGQNRMSEGTVRQWCRICQQWEGEQTLTMKSGICRPPVVSDNLVQSVDHKINDWGRLIIFRTFVCRVPQNSRTFPYETFAVRVGYHKFYGRWAPKILAGGHKTQRMVSGFHFFRATPQKWRWIFQSRRTSNRWWHLGFISEWWYQRAVKAVDAHTITKQAEKV
jgi:hypothetical protein